MCTFWADLLGEQKVRPLAGRDPPVQLLRKHEQTTHGSRIMRHRSRITILTIQRFNDAAGARHHSHLKSTSLT